MANGSEDSRKQQTAALENIYGELGNPGRFTVFQFCVYCLGVGSITFSIVNFVFIGYVPIHQCARLDNETLYIQQNLADLDTNTTTFTYHECSITLTSPSYNYTWESCLNGHDYHGRQHTSFVSEWNYVCEAKTGLTAFAQTSLMFGQGAGAFIITIIADKYGRKPVVMTSCAGLLVAGLVAAYAPNIYVLIAAKFVAGFFQQGNHLVPFTLVMESLVPRLRRHLGALAGVNWNSWMCVMALTAWLLRDSSWRTLQAVTGLCAGVVVLHPWFLYESTRWLVANQKYDRALAILKKACKTNDVEFSKLKHIFDDSVRTGHGPQSFKKDPASDNDKSLCPAYSSKQDVRPHHSTRHSLLKVIKNKMLLKNTVLILITWVTCSTTYYGLILASSSLTGDRYLNFFIMSSVDFLGDIVIYCMLDRIGRRVLTMTCLCVTGGGLLAASLCMAYGTSDLTKSLTTVFYVIGKFGIGVSFSAIFVYTPELYPTNLRTAGLGLCSSLSRLGGMMAPFSVYLTEYVTWGPGAVFTAMCAVSAVLLTGLPETRGRPLPGTLEEMEDWKRGRRRRRSMDKEEEEDEIDRFIKNQIV